jgi:hypothetical protein
MDSIVQAAIAAAVAAVKGDAAPKGTTRKTTAKATTVDDTERVPSIARWHKTVACKPGGTFTHTRRDGTATQYRRLTLDQARELLEAAYASGAFYATRA